MRRLGLVLCAVGLLTVATGAAVVYAQSTTTVVMTEFAFNPATLTVPAGRETFVLNNAGQFPHTMHIEGNGISVDVAPAIDGGQTESGTVTLTPGTYQVWCPVDGHRERGMEGTLTVAGAAAGGAAQLPSALPRTGDAGAGLPVGQFGLVIGALLIGAGLFVRRRSRSQT
ncbi:MAG: cupredoxin domain-containing protein [Chloroflexi bacterium]|nr:cupredoxin domain-containing protein [Chloroflexota bacterium]